MASKKDTAVTATKFVPKTRGTKPSYLRMQPQCAWIWLQVKSKQSRPVKAWAYRTQTGWTGWLEQFRNAPDGQRQVMPTHWSSDVWTEVEHDGTKSADVEVSVVSVNTKKGKGRK